MVDVIKQQAVRTQLCGNAVFVDIHKLFGGILSGKAVFFYDFDFHVLLWKQLGCDFVFQGENFCFVD